MSGDETQRKARSSGDGRHNRAEGENGGRDNDVATGYRPPSILVIDDSNNAVAVHTAIRAKEIEHQGVATDVKNMQHRDKCSGTKKDDKEAAEAPTPSSPSTVASVEDLKVLWIFFQCLWPMLIASLCERDYMALILLPYAWAFWLVAYRIRGNILNEFIGASSWYPSIFWWGVYISGEPGFALLIVLLTFLTFSIPKICHLGCANICQGLIIVSSGKLDAFERWLAKYLPEPFTPPEDCLDEQDDEESASKGDIKIQNLERLEKLSREGKLKRPTWVLGVLGIACVWQFMFLFFFGDTLVLFNIEPPEVPGTHKAELLAHGVPTPDEYFDKKEYAVELTENTFEKYLDIHDAVFIHWSLPLAVDSQRLQRTWENFARYEAATWLSSNALAHETPEGASVRDWSELPRNHVMLGVAKVDCVTNAKLCQKHKVVAFPTLRWYEYGEAVSPNYTLPITIDALKAYTKTKLEVLRKQKADKTKKLRSVGARDHSRRPHMVQTVAA